MGELIYILQATSIPIYGPFLLYFTGVFFLFVEQFMCPPSQPDQQAPNQFLRIQGGPC